MEKQRKDHSKAHGKQHSRHDHWRSHALHHQARLGLLAKQNNQEPILQKLAPPATGSTQWKFQWKGGSTAWNRKVSTFKAPLPTKNLSSKPGKLQKARLTKNSSDWSKQGLSQTLALVPTNQQANKTNPSRTSQWHQSTFGMHPGCGDWSRLWKQATWRTSFVSRNLA